MNFFEALGFGEADATCGCRRYEPEAANKENAVVEDCFVFGPVEFARQKW